MLLIMPAAPSGRERPPKLRGRLPELALEDAPERSRIAHADIRQDLIYAAAGLSEESPHRFHAFQLQVLSRGDAVGHAELAVESAQAHVAMSRQLPRRRRSLQPAVHPGVEIAQLPG